MHPFYESIMLKCLLSRVHHVPLDECMCAPVCVCVLDAILIGPRALPCFMFKVALLPTFKSLHICAYGISSAVVLHLPTLDSTYQLTVTLTFQLTFQLTVTVTFHKRAD